MEYRKSGYFRCKIMRRPHTGWPALKAFDIHTESAAHLPPEAVDVAKEIARIPNPGTRKTVAEAILTLVRKYFEE